MGGGANDTRERATHTERAIQIGLVAEANGVVLDPLKYVSLLDKARLRDEWEAAAESRNASYRSGQE